MSANNGPIADLSYRNYDGPKGVTSARWLPIAKCGIRTSIRKKGFWVLALLSCSAYLFLILMLFMKNTGRQLGDLLPSFPAMLGSVYGSGFWPFILALMVGAGCIAADNRANALQVYLSKPITKRDYLVGKWAGIFFLVFAVYFAPLLFVTLYYSVSEGFVDFIKADGLMFLKLIPLAAIPAAIHASVLVGISAWNKTPWLVGVIYAGIYLFSMAFANILAEVFHRDLSHRALDTLRNFSVPGAIGGIGSNILGVAPKGIGEIGRRGAAELPFVLPLILIAVLLSAIGIFMASMRIRAVEVSQG